MKRNTTIVRKAGALLLLVLFLFIHLAKLCHVHDTVGKDRYAATEQVKKGLDCSICDYHLTKDGHNAEVTFHLAAPLQPEPVFATHCPAPFTSVGLAYSDRGPPAQA